MVTCRPLNQILPASPHGGNAQRSDFIIPPAHQSMMLNASNSHCYLRYRKHDPTTDINTFNATALLIFRYTIDTIYDIDRLIYH